MPLRVYLASPYSHDDPAVRADRYEAAMCCVQKLLKQGLLAFSPIVHSHPMKLRYDMSGDFLYWANWCHSFIKQWADAVFVLTLDGWKDSVGVKHELETALSCGLPIIYLDAREYSHD